MSDDFDAAVSASLQPNPAQSARVGYASAFDTAPDAYAEAKRIERRTGIQADSVLAYPNEAKKQAAVGTINFDTLAKTAPATAGLLADVERAKIAHDDVENLQGTENVLKSWQGPAPSFGSVSRGFAETLKFKPLVASLRLAMNDLMFGAGGDAGDQVRRADLVRKAGQAQAQQDATTPAFESSTASGLYSGGVSLLQNLPGLAASIMSGSPAPGLALAGINSAAPAYGKYSARGASAGEAAGGALAEGALEVATEALPMGFMVKNFGRVGMGEFLAGMLGREIPSEIVATVTQNLVDAAVANPDVTMQDYLRQQPDAIYQTILATLVQGGVMGGASKVVQVASGRAAQAQAAEQHAAQMEALNQMAAASKVLQRDPESFEAFVAEAAGGSPVQTVFIDAQALMQSGVAEQVAAASPAVAAQIADAAQTGGTIAIPVEEYAARIAPTEAAVALLDHLKTDPEGFSRAEAQAYMQEQAPALRAEVERIVAEQKGDESFKASAGVVKDIIKQQLDATGRFTPDVHDAYASMVGNFYAVQAAKMGIAPEELYQRYPLTVGAEMIGGAQLDQGDRSGNVSVMDDANNVAGKQAPNPAGDVETGGATPRYTSRNWREWSELPQFQSDDESTVLFNHGHDGYIGQVERRQTSVFDGLFALTSPGLNERGPDVTAFRIPDDKMLSQRDLDYELDFDDVASALIDVFPKSIEQGSDRFDAAWSAVVEDKSDFESLGLEDDGSIREDSFMDILGYSADEAGDASWEAQKLRSRLAEKLGYQAVQMDDENGSSWHIVPGVKSIPLPNEQSASANPDAYEQGPRGGSYGGPESVLKNDGKINVDGVMRPTSNSKGQPIHPTEEGVRNFWRWFGDSKVVDAEGRPLVVYHGTPNSGFSEFSKNKLGTGVGGGGTKSGFFFSSSPKTAQTYAGRDALSGISDAREFLGGNKQRNPAAAFVQKFNGPPDQRAEARKQFSDLLRRVDSAAADEFDADARHEDDAIRTVVSKFKAAPPFGGASTLAIDLFNFFEDLFGTFFSAVGKGYAPSVYPVYVRMTVPHVVDMTNKDAKGLAKFVREGKKKNADGIEFKNIQDGGNASDHYLVFDPSQVKSATGNAGAFDPANPNILHQGPRGAFSPSRWNIAILKDADLSTFLHETGHAFLEMQLDMAARLSAIQDRTLGEQEIVADAEALMRWFGLRDLAEWQSLDFEERRAYHEQFARGFEAYLFEGKAPSIELQGIFQRFRAWLMNIYRDLKALNVELTDEVRSVFDRMLATNEQIQLAEMGRSMMPMFSTAQEAGMTPEEFAAYQGLGTQATADAIEDLQARGLRDLAWIQRARSREIKRLQKQAKEARDEITREVRREVMARPVYQAWQFLTGKSDEAAEAGKLSLAGLDDIGASQEAIALAKARRMTAKEGIHPDLVAERFGFDSGDALVNALTAATPPAEEVEALTDQRMLEQHGDLVTPEAIERAADMAIHNDARARMVATEANALAKAAGQRKILADAARTYAAELIARLKVRAIRPTMYGNAEVRAARAAEKASRDGDLETAAAEKRNQLVQGYAARAAYDAQDEIDAGLRYLKKFDSDGTRKGLTPDYLDQIDALLDRFDLRKGQSLKAIDKRKSLTEWLNAQREAGLEPDIPPELENEALRQSYKDMTVEAFRGLVDAVKQIEHLGRLKQRLLTAADQRTYEAIRDEIAGSIQQHAGNRQADTRTPDTVLGRALATVKRFGAAHIKVATWARIMDGGKEGGPVWEYFVRQANAKADFETTRRADATQALSAILDPVFKAGKLSTRTHYPSIGRSLTREGRIAIALNWGNDGNRQRLVGGEGWTPAQILPVLQSLTAEEWRAVQAIWDHFESYRPEIAAKERRVYGKEPAWVQPIPFTLRTADGQEVSLRGGYYPIKYDPAASQRAEEHADAEGAKRQMQGAYTSATTRRSFTKTRTEEVTGRPLLYSLSGVYSGVNDVIHDLAWHEWLIDTNRLLRSQTIDSAIREHYGPDVKAQFKTWAADIAEGEKGTQDAVDSALNFVRRSVSVAGLGFNVMSAVQQPLGLTQSVVVVGARWIGRGLAHYIAAPIKTTREVNAKSSFMENRARTRFRELNELRNQVEGQTKAKELTGRYAYWLMMRFQQAVDVPTWIGGYERAIAAGNAEDRAIALADQAVIDSQGGGQVKDQAAIERTGPGGKLFTVFYSFMNTALNVGVAEGMTEASRAKLAAKYALLYIVPPMLGYALKNALTPGDAGDDDPEKLSRKLAAQQIDYLMGLMVGVRELSDVAKTLAGANDMGRDYQGPAGLRLVADAGTFSQQLAQGEIDDAFRKSFVNIVGDLAGLPSAQINRTITGVKALAEGETDNPAAIAFGFQTPH